MKNRARILFCTVDSCPSLISIRPSKFKIVMQLNISILNLLRIYLLFIFSLTGVGADSSPTRPDGFTRLY